MAGVSAEDIVQAAYQLQGAPYRPWRSGNAIPMWQEDDIPIHGTPMDSVRAHLLRVGVMGADLMNFALMYRGLETNGGTGTFANYLVRTGSFDPDTPGQRGAIALRPYQGPQDDGSIALYVGPHKVIQSIPGEGVTDRYTDQQTYSWTEPRYHFTIYGFLRGVRY
jgi:hypothetical protein